MVLKRIGYLVCVVAVVFLAASPALAQQPKEAAAKPAEEQAQPSAEQQQLGAEDKLVVVWTSADRDVALKMVFMYTFNASTSRFGWWQDVTLIIWGPSAKLLSEDKELQEYLGKMKEAGIRLEACKACADMYGVSEKLQELGVDVKYLGQGLTDYIKEGRHVITF